MAAVLLVVLNIADAWLLRTGGVVSGDINFDLFAPPIMVNLVARGLIAIAIVLFLYMITKGGWLWWLDLAILGLISWHLADYWILHGTPFTGLQSLILPLLLPTTSLASLRHSDSRL